jgi:hypothetical protein
MRRPVVAALFVLAMIPNGAHAAPLASCKGFVPFIGGSAQAPVVSTIVTCRAQFSLSAPTAVTMNLTPGPDFVGGVTGTFRSTPPTDSHNLRANFIASLSPTDVSATWTLPAGNWELEIKAGDPSPAVGDFSGNAS